MPLFGGHRKALIQSGANVRLVEDHLHYLLERGIPKSQAAIDFFDELMDAVEAK